MIARSTLLALSLGMFSVAPVSSTYLPPQYLPVYGGSGGTAFTRSCGAGKVLTGLRFRGGLLVDAVGILCRPVLADGTLGPESNVGTLAGGGGGTAGTSSCGAGRVVSRAHIAYGTYVNFIDPYCQDWNAGTRRFGGTAYWSGVRVGSEMGGGTFTNEACEALTQPANGIQGRAHSLVDAIGLICNEP
jgi:hypothetical protein